MARKGLTHDAIIDEALKLIEEKGYDSFSLRELASRLDVQPASLYNHISGINELYTAVALQASEILHAILTDAMEGKAPDPAFVNGVYAYRAFTEEHPELYKALINIPSPDDEQVRMASFHSFEPLREIVRSYGLEEKDPTHFTRMLRSFIHGFVELKGNGFMYWSPVSAEETFDFAIHQFLTYLKEYSSHG